MMAWALMWRGKWLKNYFRKRIKVSGARVLVLGLAFKENCPISGIQGL